MADFTYASAGARIIVQMAAKKWVNAFVCRQTNGLKIACRVQRYESPASAGSRQFGGWVDVTDDAVD
jgi:hypothetical protein